jgi:hypothetical protein
VSDICGELYGEAAKCNKYMGNSGTYAVSERLEIFNFGSAKAMTSNPIPCCFLLHIV